MRLDERHIEPRSFITPVRDVDPPERTHIVICVPGLSTDGNWVDEARVRSKYYNSTIEFVKLTPLSQPWLQHAIVGFGLRDIEHDIAIKIFNVILKYDGDGKKISILAHSLGCAITEKAIRSLNYKFNIVIFAGSICHRRHSSTISQKCGIFINSCGTNDPWPFYLEVVKFWCYSATGTLGFGTSLYANDLFYETDHHSCTASDHIDSVIVPLLMGTTVAQPENPKRRYSRMCVYVTRCVFLTMSVVAPLILWALYKVAQFV